MKRHGVGTRPYCSHFLCGNASPCRPVPPFSHKSKASVGALYLIQFRNPRHSVKSFSSYVIRAPGQGSALTEGGAVDGKLNAHLTQPVGNPLAKHPCKPVNRKIGGDVDRQPGVIPLVNQIV